MRKYLTFLPLLVTLGLLSAPVLAQVTVNYIFSAGTIIDPDQVNDNFNQLATKALNRTGGTLTGNLAVDTFVTVDGLDLSAAVANKAGAATIAGAWAFSVNPTFATGIALTAPVVTGTTTLNGLTYTWPASQTANTYLRTNGSGTLTWATVDAGSLSANGRLTLTSGTAVTTADVAAAGTIYYTPYNGNRISVYDGATWITSVFAERSLALTVTSGSNYDVFIYDNVGTLTLELSAAWTNDTTRATALVLQDGVYVKSGATTRRYLGTLRASAANVTEDSFAKRLVWNAYNRAPRTMRRLETTDTWTYASATWRQANASTANQLEVVVGLPEDVISITVNTIATSSTTSNMHISIGEDSTTTRATGALAGTFPASLEYMTQSATLITTPALGRHIYVWLETGNAGANQTQGDGGAAVPLSGIVALWRS